MSDAQHFQRRKRDEMEENSKEKKTNVRSLGPFQMAKKKPENTVQHIDCKPELAFHLTYCDR